MPYSIQSQHFTALATEAAGIVGHLIGPYFSSLLAVLQCSKRKGSCLLQMSNTHTHCGEIHGDAMHEGIAK